MTNADHVTLKEEWIIADDRSCVCIRTIDGKLFDQRHFDVCPLVVSNKTTSVQTTTPITKRRAAELASTQEANHEKENHKEK